MPQNEQAIAAAMLATVTNNYAAHHACADRLDALQSWTKEQAGKK